MWLRVRSFKWLMHMWFFTWVETKVQSKAGWNKSCGNISYRCPVWSAAEPPLALCQQTLRDGRHRAPPLRTQAGRTQAAPPQTGSGFQCLWCLLGAHSSSGRLYTARKTNRINFFGSGRDKKKKEERTTTASVTRCILVITWCLFSMSKPRSMSIGWSSKMEKEQGRKSPSIWTWAAGGRQERNDKTALKGHELCINCFTSNMVLHLGSQRSSWQASHGFYGPTTLVKLDFFFLV